jgi:uncharacterized glyoxalase superfamily protein PhnB
MRFNGICLVSARVGDLRRFYMDLLQREPSGDEHWWVDFDRIGDNGAQLSIYSAEGMEQMAPGSMDRAGAGRSTIELEVEDVDVVHERLVAGGAPVVKPPTTQPWGRRSVWVRDPDGNIVNLYMDVE